MAVGSAVAFAGQRGERGARGLVRAGEAGGGERLAASRASPRRAPAMPVVRAASRSVTAAGRRLKKAALALGASGREPGTVTAAASALAAARDARVDRARAGDGGDAAGGRRGVDEGHRAVAAREAVAPGLPAPGEPDDVGLLRRARERLEERGGEQRGRRRGQALDARAQPVVGVAQAERAAEAGDGRGVGARPAARELRARRPSWAIGCAGGAGRGAGALPPPRDPPSSRPAIAAATTTSADGGDREACAAGPGARRQDALDTLMARPVVSNSPDAAARSGRAARRRLRLRCGFGVASPGSGRDVARRGGRRGLPRVAAGMTGAGVTWAPLGRPCARCASACGARACALRRLPRLAQRRDGPGRHQPQVGRRAAARPPATAAALCFAAGLAADEPPPSSAWTANVRPNASATRSTVARRVRPSGISPAGSSRASGSGRCAAAPCPCAS